VSNQKRLMATSTGRYFIT